MNFIPKNFKIKHQLLGLLKSQMKEDTPDGIRLSQIAEILKVYDKKSLYDHLYVLDENKHIVFLSTDEDPKFMITKQGVKSFIDEEYYKDGRKERLELIYDILKILAALTVLITFFRTICLEYQNKIAIEKIESKISQQEQKVKAIEIQGTRHKQNGMIK